MYSVTFYFCCSTLYDEGHATVPKLAEKLTLELVHHIQVKAYRRFTLTVHYITFTLPAPCVKRLNQCVIFRNLCLDWKNR